MRRVIQATAILLLSVLVTISAMLAWRYRIVILWTGSPQEIEAAALRQARADIDAGHPGVYLAGTVGVWPVGMPAHSLALIEGLPQTRLPSGCGEPLAEESAIFAATYNREVLEYVSGFRDHP